MSFSNDNNFHENDKEEYYYYVLDNPIPSRSRSRFLANIIINEGTYCDPNNTKERKNMCNGSSVG
ncbi:hypothetical protein TorRG33x02_012610 [Trema orientale]|uniref:Uncharacterized protein n=1 Tax=Trema orientale TaxID=63057 RepID=A0A2P5FZH3_TREOI|nr:hypothetical protein TorRG33x02_012610 [Trema orientale]